MASSTSFLVLAYVNTLERSDLVPEDKIMQRAEAKKKYDWNRIFKRLKDKLAGLLEKTKI